MDKSFIEKRIEQRAEQRLEKEYGEIISFIKGNKILSNLKTTNPNPEKKNQPYFLVASCKNSLLSSHFSNMNREEDRDRDRKGSNIMELLQSRREQLIKEETDIVFEQLESVKYLFASQQ